MHRLGIQGSTEATLPSLKRKTTIDSKLPVVKLITDTRHWSSMAFYIETETHKTTAFNSLSMGLDQTCIDGYKSLGSAIVSRTAAFR